MAEVRISTMDSSVVSAPEGRVMARVEIRAVSSTMTTAFAFGGSGAPVVMRDMDPFSRGGGIEEDWACEMDEMGNLPWVEDGEDSSTMIA